jgi:hypothetical protein
MTDKGYDSQTNRAAALARGITPVIPRRENSKQRGRFFPKRLYKLRARVEQAIGKLKHSNVSPCAARRPTSATQPSSALRAG